MSIGKAAARLFTDPAVARSVLDELFPRGGLGNIMDVRSGRVTPTDVAIPMGVARARGVPEEALVAARNLSESMPGPDAMRTALAIMEQPQSMADDILGEVERIGGRDARMLTSSIRERGYEPVQEVVRDADQWNTLIIGNRDRMNPATAFKDEVLDMRDYGLDFNRMDSVQRDYLRSQQARRYMMQQLLESAAGGDQPAAREMARQLGLISLLDDPSWVAR